jgi:hypothetical protein
MKNKKPSKTDILKAFREQKTEKLLKKKRKKSKT